MQKDCYQQNKLGWVGEFYSILKIYDFIHKLQTLFLSEKSPYCKNAYSS